MRNSCLCLVLSFLCSQAQAQQPNITPQPQPEDVANSRSNTDPNLQGNKINEFDQLEAEILSYLEPYAYDVEGRRDPFQPFKFDLQPEDLLSIDNNKQANSKKQDSVNYGSGSILNFNLQQLTLKAILWDVKNPKIIVQDPNSKSHTLRLNDKIGNSGGYIAAVREGEVIVVQKIKARGKTLVYTKYMYLKR